MSKSWVAGVILVAAVFFVGCGEDDPGGGGQTSTSFVAIETFQVNELRVEAGGTVNVQWAVSNARSVELFANEEPVDIGGQVSGAIDLQVNVRTDLRLQARGRDDQIVRRTITVEVKNTPTGPLILSFVASPAEVDENQPTTLAWSTVNATSVRILDAQGATIPLGGAGAASGSVEVEPEGDTSYVLVAENGAEEVERTLFVKVRGSPRTQLSVSPTRVEVGQPVTLTWAAEGATRVQIREVGGKILVESDASFDGSLEVVPERSTTYELRATGTWRDGVSTASVDVNPQLLSFELVDEGPIGLGVLATVRWETAGATEVRLSNLEGYEEAITGYRVREGTARIPMGQGGRFQIVVLGGVGAALTQEVSAEVLDLPSIGSFVVTPEITSQQVQPVRVTVAWSGIQNASEVQLVGDTFGRVGLFEPPFEDGILELWLRETASLTLTARNRAGEVTREATATLVPLPAIETFRLFPRHAAPGETIEIAWDVEGAQTVSLEWNGEALPIDPSAGQATFPFTVTEPGFFTLTAVNSAGGVTQRTRELTVGGPEIRNFSTPSTILPLGSSIVFTWTNLGGTHLELLQDGAVVCEADTPEQVESGGCTIFGGQAQRSIFTLRLTNGIGETVERSLSVIVTNGPIVTSFTAEQETACPGETVRLSWETTPDQAGELANLQLVDSLGNSYDLTGHNPLEGTYRVPHVGLGPVEFKLIASTPGTFSDEASLYIEMVEETHFSVATVEPAVVSVGEEVTITWDTICADEVSIVHGDLKPMPSNEPWQDFSATATRVPVTFDCSNVHGARDEGCEIIDFPGSFTFPFDGQVHSSIKVWVNGFASFDLARTGSSWSTSTLPSSSNSHVNLPIYWGDLFLSTSDVNFYHQLVQEGGRQGFVIQWGELSDGTQMQMVLFEDGTFSYRYGATSRTGSNGRIGWQNLSGTHATMITQNAAITGGVQNKSWSFGYGTGGPSGSYTFTPTSSRDILLKASGLGEAETTVQVTVQ